MKILLAFAPFLAFAVLENLAGILPGLVAWLAASLALIVRERARGARGIGLLEAGSALVLGALAAIDLDKTLSPDVCARRGILLTLLVLGAAVKITGKDAKRPAPA